MNKLIEEIKIHDKRYTVILVVVFVLLIMYGCYYILSIDNKNITTNNINYRYSDISSSYQMITLTNEHQKYSINIDNNTSEPIKYKVLLLEDTNTKKLCECSDKKFDLSTIKYSINGEIKSLKDNVVLEGSIAKNKSVSLNVSMWLEKNDHFHGYFKIIK